MLLTYFASLVLDGNCSPIIYFIVLGCQTIPYTDENLNVLWTWFTNSIVLKNLEKRLQLNHKYLTKVSGLRDKTKSIMHFKLKKSYSDFLHLYSWLDIAKICSLWRRWQNLFTQKLRQTSIYYQHRGILFLLSYDGICVLVRIHYLFYAQQRMLSALLVGLFYLKV